MREAYGHDGHAASAILAGARQASRVVGCAAVIMVAVFVSFLTTKEHVRDRERIAA
jgi:hypothetical protein